VNRWLVCVHEWTFRGEELRWRVHRESSEGILASMSLSNRQRQRQFRGHVRQMNLNGLNEMRDSVATSHAFGTTSRRFEPRLRVPLACAAMPIRPPSSRARAHFVASLRSDAIVTGTAQSVKISSLQAGRAAPSFSSLANLNPGAPLSTTSAVRPFSPFSGSCSRTRSPHPPRRHSVHA